MTTNLKHLKEGDKIARKLHRHFYSSAPFVEYEIRTIVRTTPTQLITDKNTRVRHDGRMIGGSFFHVFCQATPEIITQTQQQLNELARYQKAVASVDDLIGLPLHRLNLSAKQLEHLAKAWVEVKAMAPAADSSKT